MLDKETLVKVTNRFDGMTAYSIPDLGIKRLFMAGETKEVTMEEIRKLNYSIGGAALLRDNLVLGNKEAVEEILGVVEPEYYYTEEDVRRLLLTGSLAELQDCLDFAPQGTIELVKKIAVETELNDILKREAILEGTGFNVTTAIMVNRETSEDGVEEEKTRRVAKEAPKAEAPANPGRRVAAPSQSKYKIVTKE
jgi:hypothetical protein